jgi:hypothetical protein
MRIFNANHANFICIECVCSDATVWLQRVKRRQEMVAGWKPADWQEVKRVDRYYEKWSGPHLVLDAINSLDLNDRLLLDYLETRPGLQMAQEHRL